MIIFEPGGGKNLILVILVVFFTGIIFWQWLASEPFSKVQSDSQIVTDIRDSTSDSFTKIRDSFAQGQEQIDDLDGELIKQAQQERLIEETKKYLSDKEANKTLDIPDNQNDCEVQGGQWSSFGTREIEECNLFTTDAGQECIDGSQCQGYCFTEDEELYQSASILKAVAAKGQCSADTIVSGKCIAFVDEGQTKGKLCID